MKNIKYLTFLFCLMSTMTFANNQDNGFNFFEENSSQKAEAPSDPDPSEDPTGTSPIDDYLPLLVIGAGLIALRYRKQLLKK